MLAQWVSANLRAAQTLRDFLHPINCGIVLVETLPLLARSQLSIRKGQCLFDDLELHDFVGQPWWQQYWSRLTNGIRDAAGKEDSEKLVLSPPVPNSAS